MNVKVFFDTSILVYSVTDGDPRADQAESLLAGGGYLSVQVLNEFAAVSRRKLKRPWRQIRENLHDIQTLSEPVLPLTVGISEQAFVVAERYGYNIYDALIIAAALAAGCQVLYSEDMQHCQKIDSLTIRNPFALPTQ